MARKTSHRTGAAVAAVTLSLLGGTITHSAAGQVLNPIPQPGWDRIGSVTPTQQWTASTATTPLVGDYNGDGRSDVFMYGPSSGADALWFGRAVDAEEGFTPNRFTVGSYAVNGTYQPLVGDFDGNGSDDIFWYAPGSNPDSIWYFDHGVRTISAVTVHGTYRPIVGNFDSADTDSDAEKDDILWWGLTTSPSLWSGQANRTFQKRSYPDGPKPTAQVLVGNFMPDNPETADGGYHLDLFVYRPGTGADSIWRGDGTGAFTAKTPKTVNGTYTPIVGDFDASSTGDPGLTDIMWYAPGSAADTVWMNVGDTSLPGTFQATSVPVNGTYKPFVIPGVRQDSVMWNNLTGVDVMWELSGEDHAFTRASVSWPGPDMGTRTPVLGLFDDVAEPEDGQFSTWGPDILWMLPGNSASQTESFWRGHDTWLVDQPEIIT